ncbi:MAG: hypothetical protein Rubg2KO_19940 [Rubricoccaceae bacterium]
MVAPGIGFTYAIGTEDAAPRFFGEHLRPGMTVWDLGANKGQMALLFASLVGPQGRVLSFEPASNEHEALIRNVTLNGMDQIETVKAAVSEQSGHLTFHYTPEHPTQGKLADVEPTYGNAGQTVTVEAVTLDDLLDEKPRPHMLKIDVEGAAAAAFRGGRRLLREVRPHLFIELHGPEEQAGVRDEVVGNGYIAYTLNGTVVSDPTNGWHSPLWCVHPDGPNV